MNNNFVKLIGFIRNNLEETSNFGCILHLNNSGIIKQIGNCQNVKFYQRSCSKPLQFSTLINEGVLDKFPFTHEEIAVCCASHTGTKQHQKHILNILDKIGFCENHLLCPIDEPLDKEEQKYLIKNNLPVRKIHNNCSGKHSAMLALCKFKGFDVSNYNEPSHPLSKLVINQICDLCQTNDIVVSKDGCTLPTVATTLPELGTGFLNMFLSEKYSIIKEAILKFPYLAGGSGRIDSEIINAGCGNLISKVGAGGIIVVINLKKQEALVVKIADANYLSRSLVVIKSMLDLGWLTENQLNNTPLKDLYAKDIKTETGEIVGSVKFEFSL